MAGIAFWNSSAEREENQLPQDPKIEYAAWQLGENKTKYANI